MAQQPEEQPEWYKNMPEEDRQAFTELADAYIDAVLKIEPFIDVHNLPFDPAWDWVNQRLDRKLDEQTDDDNS